MSLKRIFQAQVEYQHHCNPPGLGLYEQEMGYTEAYLGDFHLDKAMIDKLGKAHEVQVTCVPETEHKEIYHPIKGIQKVRWKVIKIELV